MSVYCKKLPIVFQVAVWLYISANNVWAFQLFQILLYLLLSVFLNFSQSSAFVVKNCGFNLHFPSNWSEPLFICQWKDISQFDIIFSEVFILIFCLFLDCLMMELLRIQMIILFCSPPFNSYNSIKKFSFISCYITLMYNLYKQQDKYLVLSHCLPVLQWFGSLALSKRDHWVSWCDYCYDLMDCDMF